jgi:hypothetical protein
MEIKQGMTMLDVAMLVAGSVEGFFALATLNGLAYTDEITPGQELNLNIAVQSASVVKYFKDKGYKPASGVGVPLGGGGGSGGIGYWSIEDNFIVS